MTKFQKNQAFKFSINRAGKNKTWDYRKLTNGFRDVETNLDGLLEAVRSGCAIAGAHFGGKPRRKVNVTECGCWLGDVDSGLSLEEAKAHPFIKKYVAAIYTSYSHTSDHHKFRLVVPLPHSVGGAVYEGIFDYFAEHLPEGTLDSARRDAGGAFYGNTRAQIWVNPDFEGLSPEILEAIKSKVEQDRSIRELESRNDNWLKGIGEEDRIRVVREALKCIPPRRPGTNTYSESIGVVMAVCSAFDGFVAEKILEEWSPSNRADGWVIPEKIKSCKRGYSGRPITLGTLFHLAGKYGFKLPSGLRSDRLKEFRDKCWQQWEESKRFTHDMEVDQSMLDIEPPEDGEFLFVSSPTATGKTTLLKRWARNELSDTGLIRFGYRNSLELQFCKEAGFYHLRLDDDAQTMLADPNCRISCCIDSIHKYCLSDFDDKVLIFDECDAVVRQALFSMKVEGNLDRLREALGRCRSAVFMSGTISDWCVDFFENLAPGKRVTRVSNAIEPERPPVFWFAGAELEEIEESTKRRLPDDRTPLIRDILGADRPISVQSDSKRCVDIIERMLVKRNPDRHILKVTSDTVDDPEVIAFLESPDEYIRSAKPWAILTSPTMESGNNITIKDYFSADYHFYFGVLGSDAVAQKLIRIRDTNCPRYVWAKEYVRSEEREAPLLNNLIAKFKRLNLEEFNVLFSGGEEAIAAHLLTQFLKVENCQFFKTAMLLKSVREFERSNYRDAIRVTLLNQNYTLEDYSGDPEPSKGLRREYRESKEEVNTEKATDIYGASDKFLNAPEDALSRDASYEDKCAIAKARLIRRIPGIQDTEHWSTDFVKEFLFDKPNLLNSLQRYWFCRNLDVIKYLSRSKLNKFNNLIAGDMTPKIWNYRNEYLLCKALVDVGLFDLIDNHVGIDICGKPFRRPWRHDSPEVTTLIKKARKHWRTFGRYPSKDNKIKYLRFLLNFVGADLSMREIRLYDNTTEKHYFIVRRDTDEVGSAIMECTARKFENILSGLAPEIVWTVSEEMPENNIPAGAGETVEFASEMDIRQLAGILDGCPSADALFEIVLGFKRFGYDRSHLNAAVRKLPLRRREVIRGWWSEISS